MKDVLLKQDALIYYFFLRDSNVLDSKKEIVVVFLWSGVCVKITLFYISPEGEHCLYKSEKNRTLFKIQPWQGNLSYECRAISLGP
jgi:hypothetical protein